MPNAALPASAPALPNFGDALMRLWPQGDKHIPGLRAAMSSQMPDIAERYGFDTQDVIAIFMGRVSLECGAGTEVVENLNYTAKRMMAVWPPTVSDAGERTTVCEKSKKTRQKVYNGRMGNRVGTDDGYDWASVL